jgi:hypothetical protein
MTVEHICDIYLKELFKSKEKGLFLNSVLNDKAIFYDQEKLKNVLQLLEDKNLILKEPHTISTIVHLHEDTKLDIKSSDGVREFFDNVEGSISRYKLTEKGKQFVQLKQVIDIEGQKEKKNLIISFINWILKILGIIS